MYRISQLKFKVLILFFLINFVSTITILLIPFNPIVGNYYEYILLNLIFVFILATAALFSYNRPLFIKKRNFDFCDDTQLSNIVVFLTIIGTILLCVDRLFIRGIDYSEGSRSARYQWISSDGGSIYSILGTLLAPCAYCVLYILIVKWKNSHIKKSIILFIVSSLSILTYSYLNGGRSNILLAIAVAIIAFIVGGHKFTTLIKKLYVVLVLFFIVIILFVYAADMTSQSAEMGSWSIKELILEDVKNLNASPNQAYYNDRDSSDFIHQLYYFVIYLLHGQWNSMEAVSLAGEYSSGSFLLYPYQVMLQKVGLLSEPSLSIFTEKGVYLSLPGAIFYDCGWFGLVSISAILGMITARLCQKATYSCNYSGFFCAIVVYFFSILFLSPVVPAYGFGLLDFICFGFVIVDIVGYIYTGKWINWNGVL